MICKDILEDAQKLIGGDRHKDYGDKLVNHQRIADLWSIYLETKIRPDQVSIMMGLVKVARSMHNPQKRDSYIDLAAYASIAGEIVERTPDAFESEGDRRGRLTAEHIKKLNKEKK